MRVAIVHEWFASYAGSERVVEQLLNLYPEADLFSLVDFIPQPQRNFLQQKPVQTSFIQNLPFARQKFRSYLPFMPLAIEQFDFSSYDLILSSHHAVAKGVLTRPDQLHICYVHTPIRYAWDLYEQYLETSGLSRGWQRILPALILHYLRLWDVATVNRVDHYLANSHFVAHRIQKTYQKPATVIYPPVNTGPYQATHPRQNFYLAIARHVPYKKMDLIVESFNQNGLPLVIIGTGTEALKAQAKRNIQIFGYQPDDVVATYLETCKAFIFAAEEDFGITVVEAQAAGAPVIAYGRGGVRETVMPGQTGLFFREQTTASLNQAIQDFEQIGVTASTPAIREQAEKFNVHRFQVEMQAFIERAWDEFQQQLRNTNFLG